MVLIELFFIYSFFSATCAAIIIETTLFNRVRTLFKDRVPQITYVLSCPVCLSFWISVTCWFPALFMASISFIAYVMYVIVNTGLSIFIINRLFKRG